jgi:hypothetical protein
MTQIQIATELLNADDARLLLINNSVNRRISQPAIIKIARDMTEGRWGVNPQPVMVSRDGRLIDGQHRLLGLIAADEMKPGVKVAMMIARNVPESVFDVVDQGQPRSSSQTLSIHGIHNSAVVAAAGRYVLRYERFPDRIWSGAVDVSKAQVIDFVLKSQDEVQLLETASMYHLNVLASGWTALHWLVIRHSRLAESWAEFSEGVRSGSGLAIGDPRLTLRNRVSSGYEKWGGGQGRLGVYIKAWNACVEGREVKLLRFTRDSLPMPVIA